jgi:4-hydroxy-2-oxoheptanedioate aldolase
MSVAVSGDQFKKELREGKPKMGLFLNAHSPTIAEQLACSGYDWLLIDTQHGPMDPQNLSAMICAIQSGGALAFVRVQGYDDRGGIQQSMDLGANGILIPYVNTAEEIQKGVAGAFYPTKGTRSLYFPQRSTNVDGLLGYIAKTNKDTIVAMQVETASCVKNLTEIAATPGLDILFIGQSDLSMSMGLWEKYKFPDMYSCPEMEGAIQKMKDEAKKNDKILGVFLFGTANVPNFLDKGFNFISVGNELHHVLTQAGAHVKDLERMAKEKGKPWTRRPTALL